jgi:integrase/recombinase XerD
MKKLPITSSAYKYIEKSFGQWLDVLGYASQTVYSMPIYVRGLLHYIEQQHTSSPLGRDGVGLKDITPQIVREYYYNHLKTRSNARFGGALSNNHLNKHIQAFKVFFDYLRQSGRQSLSCLNIPMEENDTQLPAVLTEPEVKQLFAACDLYPQGTAHRKPDWFYPIMALRDKAMLSVYYSCGLRRNEGVHVELNDVFFEKQILHVRKGKNNKERFVPISKSALRHLETYLYDARPMLLKNKRSERFFINERGNPMSDQMMIVRMHTLLSRTENTILQEKKPGLHTLRHSIATHLLANGMKLEKIKDFLGHSSLESTQIYTHLLEADTNCHPESVEEHTK